MTYQTNSVCHYGLLDVRTDASHGEIERAVRKMLLQYHPDKNKHPSAPRIVDLIQQAHKVLTDPVTRAAYDKTRSVRVLIPAPLPVASNHFLSTRSRAVAQQTICPHCNGNGASFSSDPDGCSWIGCNDGYYMKRPVVTEVMKACDAAMVAVALTIAGTVANAEEPPPEMRPMRFLCKDCQGKPETCTNVGCVKGFIWICVPVG